MSSNRYRTAFLKSAKMEGLASTGLGLIGGIANSAFSASQTENMKRRMAAMNFGYNERAAQNAMQRGLYMYNNTQSWAAQVKQLKEAGLSPGLILGSATSGGAVNGPQGGGGAGQTGQAVISPLEAANLGLIKAQTEKTEMEARNIAKNTEKQNAEIGNILMDTGLKSAQTIGQNLNNAGTEIKNAREAIGLAKDDTELYYEIATFESRVRQVAIECERMERINEIEKETKDATIQKAVWEATETTINALYRMKELNAFDTKLAAEIDELMSRTDMQNASANYTQTLDTFKQVEEIVFRNQNQIDIGSKEGGESTWYQKSFRRVREVINLIKPITKPR